MKRLSAVLLAAGMLLTCFSVGCGRKKPESDPIQIEIETAPVSPETEAFHEMTEAGGKPMLYPAETEAPAVVTEVVTVTEIVQITEIVTVIQEVPADSYDAGTLTETEPLVTEGTIDKDGVYTTKDDVALYIYTYGELPKNFITKKEAQKLGWEGGSLEPYAPGCCIGGSYFGNYEGSLPDKPGREYTECDIDTLGKKSRGAKRIVFSNDGLIYYTGDHYKTFELLYGEE